MDSFILLLALLGLLALYLLRHHSYTWRYLTLLYKLPWGYGFVPGLGNLLQIAAPMHKMIPKFQVLVKKSKHPFILWVGPILPAVIIYKPQHIKVILNNVKHINKPSHYTFFEPWLGNGIFISGGTKWHDRRKLIAPSFQFKILEGFLKTFCDKSQIMVKKLEKQIGSAAFDAFPFISLCALDIICETVMGVDLKAQDGDEKSEYVNAVDRIAEAVMHRVRSPWFHPHCIYKRTPESKRVQSYVKVLDDTSKKILSDRREQYKNMKSKSKIDTEEDLTLGRKKMLTFLDLLLESVDNGAELTDVEIRKEMDSFIFAGYDTTAVACTWATQMLASHPDVQDKVYEELESISGGTDHPFTMNDLNEMKYLERVIKETLRLYPSAPFIARELNEEVELDEYTIPSGALIIFISLLTHRDPEHYPNPEKFDPDRFLPENIINRHPYAYIPFSAGPRNCLGQKYGMLELKVMLSYLVRHYTIHVTGEIPKPVPGVILKPKDGVRITITKRENSVP